MGEEALHLAIELCGQRLVVAEDEGGAAHILDDIGHGEGLARAGDTQQRLCGHTAQHPLGELCDGFGLVAHGPVV